MINLILNLSPIKLRLNLDELEPVAGEMLFDLNAVPYLYVSYPLILELK